MCIALNANELHIPAPSPEEGITYTTLCITYDCERENQCVQPYIWEAKYVRNDQSALLKNLLGSGRF